MISTMTTSMKCRPEMLPLFDDPDPDPCAKGHVFVPATHRYADETFVRLVWRCLRCGEIRGRA